MPVWPATRQRLAAMLLAVVLIFCPFHPAAAQDSYTTFLEGYTGLLRDYLRPVAGPVAYQGVDYNAWRNDMRHERALVSLLRSVPPEGGDAAKAYWLNAYNFLIIDLIVMTGEEDSIQNLGTFFHGPWTGYEWSFGAKDISLARIERDILKPMQDARISFAMACGAVSCPDLREQPFLAADMDAQLDDQVRHMLADAGKGLRLDDDGRGVHVTRIMTWDKKDFGSRDAWLRRYRADLPEDMILKFMPYDWSLNDVPMPAM